MRKIISSVVLSSAAFLSGCGSESLDNNLGAVSLSDSKAGAVVEKVETKVPEGALALVNGEPVYSHPERLQAAIQEKLAAQAFAQSGADTKSLDAQIETIKTQLYAQGYINSMSQSISISDGEIQSRYEKLKAEVDLHEYKIKFSQFDIKDEAVSLINSLSMSKERLAELNALAGNSGKAGEWMSKHQVPLAFQSMIAEMKAGSVYPEAISTDKGYFVLYLEDKKKNEMLELDDSLRERIKVTLIQKEINKRLSELQGKAVILLTPPPE